MAESNKQLKNVEADVIRYFVWREIIGEEGWFEKGLKELACCVKRHEKSIGKAVKSLEVKGMIQKEKKKKRKYREAIKKEEEEFRKEIIAEYEEGGEARGLVTKKTLEALGYRKE